MAPRGAESPAMAEVSLLDARFSTIPKIRATLVAKRQSVGIYKGRLCARGDSSPPDSHANHAYPYRVTLWVEIGGNDCDVDRIRNSIDRRESGVSPK